VISYRIGRRFIVLPAVHFNDDKSFATNEIADVIAYRLLPYKLIPIDLAVANAVPKNGFRVCLIDAQASRDSDHLAIWATHCLAPHPKFPLRANFDLSPQKSGERLRKTYLISPFIAFTDAQSGKIDSASTRSARSR
jgi:hypothetical protein